MVAAATDSTFAWLDPAVAGDWISLGSLLVSIAVGVIVIGQFRQVKQQLKDSEAQQKTADKIASLDARFRIDGALTRRVAEQEWVSQQYSIPLKDQDIQFDIRTYLAAFDLVAQAVASGFISHDDAYYSYHFRLRLLLLTRKARQVLRLNRGSWTDLITFIIDLDEHAQTTLKKQPIIVVHDANARTSQKADDQFRRQLEAAITDDAILANVEERRGGPDAEIQEASGAPGYAQTRARVPRSWRRRRAV